MTESYITGNRDERRSLVVVFLRGGADGLNIVAPVGDDGYYRARPRIAIKPEDSIPLDGFFGLNPLLKELLPAWRKGDLGLVHCVGSEDGTRSHFEAQDLMEHGGVVAGGWLGRFLRYRENVQGGALSAIAFGKTVPESLRGAPSAAVMESIGDFTLGKNSAAFSDQLATLYGQEDGVLGGAAMDTLTALRRIEGVRDSVYQPSGGAEYEGDRFSRGMLQIARLIKARVGMEAASIDLGGWDSHFSQGSLMNPLMVRLAKGLGAFYADMGAMMATTTVVVMTEFGRRLRENSAFGTDHGRGSVMFVLGGGVAGGGVTGDWKGLSSDVLEGPGDLPVTTDYRNVLASVLNQHGAGEMDKVFPGFDVTSVPLY